ncbi:5' nucleotidase, NT5C type [Jiulongibacter sp. NS-SX5]|uniref:5' nucleotidase, NT5C type n=1 Tax=Jiulongibacter sp. NS-SX5 TaxID=3463854 RepID=UPI0040590128
MSKQRLIIDMDDVMADTGGAIIDLYNKHFKTSYQKSDLLEQDIWNEELKANYVDELRSKLHEPGFFRNLSVMTGAKEVIKELHEKYDLFVVSAAMEFPNSLKEKSEWLDEHFPYIHWKNRVLCGDKSIIKGDIMIDDHDKNLSVFKGQCLLFHAMHNHKLEWYQRVKSWKDVAVELL